MSRLFANENMEERITSIIRVGEVTSIDPARGTCRVTFDDEDGLTSYDLPVIQRNTLRNSDYHMPDIGEDVLCVFLASGTEEGFVLGSWYAGEVTPPEFSGDKRTVRFADGTVLSYDRAAHKLTADVKGDIEATVSGNVTATIQGKADVTAQGAISVESSEKVIITAPQIVLNGAISSYSKTGGAGTMKVTGTMDITGNITGDSDIIASGVSLKSHTHTCPDGTTSTPK